MNEIEGYAAEVHPLRSAHGEAPLLVHIRELRLLWHALRTTRHRESRPARARLGRYTIRLYRYALRVRGHPWLLLLLLHELLLLSVDASISRLYRRALPWDGTVQKPSYLAAPIPRL
jgi:hypothetical protein